ncbi:MAG TPA: hypothetical protein VII69_04010 [Candidatus Eremiobacteraceae bacterium]
MRISSLGKYALGASVALVLSTGCSGTGPQTSINHSGADLTAQQFIPRLQLGENDVGLSYRALTPGAQFRPLNRLSQAVSYNACPAFPILFISDPTTPEIYIFTARENLGGQVLCGAILGHGLSKPQGLDLDKRGRLYVANSGASNILIFPPPYVGVAPLVMNDPGQVPVGVEADCGKFVWVTNLMTTIGGTGTITKYPPGGAAGTFADPAASREYVPTCDPANNVYTTYLDSSGVGHANKFPFPLYAPVGQVGVTLAFPGGADYEDGTLLLGDQLGRTIVPCPGGASPCGAPILLNAAGDPVTFDLNARDDDVFTADSMLDGFQEYDYPSGAFDDGFFLSPHQFVGVALWKDDEP